MDFHEMYARELRVFCHTVFFYKIKIKVVRKPGARIIMNQIVIHWHS